MGRGQILGVFLILGTMLVAACAPQAAPAAPAPAPAAPAPAPAPASVAPAPRAALAKPAWEVEWEKTLEAAKKEGPVILFTSNGADVRKAQGEGLKKAYGVTLESITIISGQFAPKIMAERRAGLYSSDLFISGSNTLLNQLKPAGVADPLEPLLVLPDVTAPELIKNIWYGGKLPWVDRDHTILISLLFPESGIAINTNLVKEGEIKSYQDLLNPKWKGKIILTDPTVGGVAGNLFMPMFVLGGVAGGTDWLRKLVNNELVVMRDSRLIVDWLAHGKVAIVLVAERDTINEFMKTGAPIARQVFTEAGAEAGAVSGGASAIAAINRAPHPNATKVFINWYLSKEGQTAMSWAKAAQSARLDVATDFLPPEGVRQPGVTYWIKEVEENLLRQPEVDKIVKTIFGPLIK